MTSITIPGRVANQLRQGLTLQMGDAAEALGRWSLIDRRHRSHASFVEHFSRLVVYRDTMDLLGWADEPEPRAVEIDIDVHREMVDAGLAEATATLRRFTAEGSPEDRRQAVVELDEVKRFTASLPAVSA